MHVGPPIPRNTLDARQKAILPLDGTQVTSMSRTYSSFGCQQYNSYAILMKSFFIP